MADPEATVGVPPHPEHARFERRQHDRISMAGRGLHGCLLPSGQSITVLDIGPGGFSMQWHEECPIGVVCLVRFWCASGDSVVVSARVTHCMRVQMPKQAPEYVAGLEFVESRMPRPLDALLRAVLPEFEM